MKKKIYEKTLNAVSQKYLIKGNEHLVEDPRRFVYEYTDATNHLCEMLLYHEGVALHVYGENIPLAILINIFGLKGFEELLEQRAFEFVLSNQIVTYMQSEIAGLMPLQSGSMTSSPHNDPEASALLGLNWLANKLPRRQCRELVRKVVKHYKKMPEKISSNTVEIAVQSYQANIYQSVGLPNTKDISKLNLDERAKLCGLATDSMELALITQLNYNTYNQAKLSKVHGVELERLKEANKIKMYTNELFYIENLPNFKELLKSKLIAHQSIPSIRNSKNAIKFREWMSENISVSDAREITKEYYSNVLNTQSLIDTPQGRFLKTIGTTLLTSSIGGLIGGTLGATIGAGTSKVFEPGIDIGLSILDEFVLDGLLKGWTPKHFFDEIRQTIID